MSQLTAFFGYSTVFFFIFISFCLCVRMLFFLFIERATLNKTLFLFLRCICQLKRWAPILNSSDDMPSTASAFVVNNASYFITIWLICSTNDKDRFAYGEINSPYSRYFFNVNFFCDSGNFWSQIVVGTQSQVSRFIKIIKDCILSRLTLKHSNKVEMKLNRKS